MLASLILFDSKQREMASMPISGAVSRIGSSEICQLRFQGLPEVLGTLQLIEGGYRLINKTANDLWLGGLQIAPGNYGIWQPGDSLKLESQGKLQLVIGTRNTGTHDLMSSLTESSESDFDYLLPGDGSNEPLSATGNAHNQVQKPQGIIASLLTIIVSISVCAGLLYYVFSDAVPKTESGPLQVGVVLQKLNSVTGKSQRLCQEWHSELQQCWILLNRGRSGEARERLLKLRVAVLNSHGNDEIKPTSASGSLLTYINQQLAK